MMQTAYMKLATINNDKPTSRLLKKSAARNNVLSEQRVAFGLGSFGTEGIRT